jgi:predicted dehydrogenase
VTQQSTIRVGVIGTGFGSLVQIPGFQRSPGVEVVAVASGRVERAREVAERFGLAGYADYRQMLAEQQLDLVSIATPPYLHHEMALAAIERGCHVLCEKPFALNLAQAREMLAAARRAGLVHAVDHEFRYLPARLKMKELVEGGYLGDLHVVRISAQSSMLLDPRSRPWSWWHDRDQGGGILGALGSHLLDALRWWFGEIVEVAAQLDTYVKSRPLPNSDEWREVTADDQVAALLRLASGAQATFLVSGLARGAGTRMEAHGSDGTLIIDEAQLLGVQGRGAPQPIELPTLPSLNQGDDFRIAPFLSFLERFLPQLRGEGEAIVASFEEGVAVQAVMDAMHESSETGRFVQVERVDAS